MSGIVLKINDLKLYKFKTGCQCFSIDGNKFFISAGYAVLLQANRWEVKDGSILTETSKRVMNITTPGGVSVGMGIQFAL